jgi:hypothetical protein
MGKTKEIKGNEQHFINYSEFLFYNLTQVVDTKHPLKDLEYDLSFCDVGKYYKEFQKSNFDVDILPEYECIVNYLENYK